METLKLYHVNPFLTSCESTVTGVDPEKGIVLDSSIAYAESGGQLGDTGVLVIGASGEEKQIPFSDTQRGTGRLLMLPDFPTVPVQTPTYHKVDQENLQEFYIGQKVRVQINVERRALLTISHSGIHLVLMGLEKLYPGIYHTIKGCSIKPDGARLDFRTEKKFTQTDTLFVHDFVQNLIARKKEMFVFPHKSEPEAWYWQLDNYVIPCGGTHLKNTEAICEVAVKKENLGKSTQRMSFTFNNYKIPYHDYKE